APGADRSLFPPPKRTGPAVRIPNRGMRQPPSRLDRDAMADSTQAVENAAISTPVPPTQPVHALGVEVDLDRRRVRVEGRDVALTDQEFRLLHLLMTHPGIVFSRDA